MSQANKTLVTLLAMLVVGGGIGLYAWFGVFEHDRKETEQKDQADRLFMPISVNERKADGGIVDSEFVKVTVVAKGDTTVLERAAGKNWRIVSPVQAPADKVLTDALVSQLQVSKFKRVVEEAPNAEAVQRYGLDKPEFTVEAVAEVGASKEKRTVKLEAGVENTYDGSIYMRRNGEPRVLSAEGGVKWTLARSTFELREKDVIGVDDSKIKSLEVIGANNAYVLTQDEKKNWKVSAKKWAGMKAGGDAGTFDGDPVAINGALGQLKAERATAFPTDTPEARKVFDAPTIDATFTLAGDEKVRLRLIQPAADAGVPATLLREAGSEVTLAAIAGTGVAQLDRLPTDFRDKRLMPFKKEEVARIRFFTATGVEIVAEKSSPDAGTADSWRIVAPKAGPAKTLKIASLLWTLGALKGTKVIEEAPKDVKKYGIDPRLKSVALFDPSGKQLASLEWGTDAYMRGSRGEVVEADPAHLSEFPKSADDLIDAPATDAGGFFPATDAGT